MLVWRAIRIAAIHNDSSHEDSPCPHALLARAVVFGLIRNPRGIDQVPFFMGCSPTRRGHEVCVLSSFIDQYNRQHGTAFSFARSLDAAGSTPQPEALYVDTRTQKKLVVEHKTFVWPNDHFKVHRSGHEVAEIIEQAISPFLMSDRPYILKLPDDMRGARVELQGFAAEVAAVIRRDIDQVHAGATLGWRPPERWWIFREESPNEREYFQPSTGLVVSFEGAWTTLPPADFTAELYDTLNDMLARVAKKFEQHGDARRLLVLDPHGDVRFTPDAEWEHLLSTVDVPPSVDEIWVSFHDFITDTVCGWMQQRVWPTLAEQHLIGCGGGDAC